MAIARGAGARPELLLRAEREVAARNLEEAISDGDLTTLKAAVSMADKLRMPPGPLYNLLERGRFLLVRLDGQEEELRKEREDRQGRLKAQADETLRLKRKDEAARLALIAKKDKERKEREERHALKQASLKCLTFIFTLILTSMRIQQAEKKARRKAALEAEKKAAELESMRLEKEAAEAAILKVEREKAEAKAAEIARELRIKVPFDRLTPAMW